MSASVIRSLSVEILDIPLDRPFGIAGGSQAMANNLLVTAELADGTRGFGEAAPLPAFNGETQEAARTALLCLREVVVGEDARGYRRIAARAKEAAASSGSARCAVETAVLDALTRQAGVSLHTFFGGVERTLESDITIPLGTVSEGRESAGRAVAMGFTTLKVKVGGVGSDVGSEVERVAAMAEAAPRARFLLDGNAWFEPSAAVDLVRELVRRGLDIVLFEQPVPGEDLDGLRAVGERTGVPVAADESVSSPADALRVVQRGAVSVINIKLMKSGIVEALDIAAIARAAGLGLMVGGMVESVLAMSASACFAAGLGGFSFVDLDTPLFLARNPFDGGYVQRGATLSVEAISCGHGVSPKP